MIQSKVPASATACVELGVVVRRRDADHRRLDRVGSERLEQIHELRRLLTRSRDDDALAEQRPLIEPSQVLPQAGDASDHEDGRHGAHVLQLGKLAQRAVGRALRRQRALVDDCRRLVFVEAVREQRFQDCGKLPLPRITDERAAEAREALPVDLGGSAAFTFVAPHERQRVPSARICERHTGVGRHTDGGRDARHHFERNAVFVQEQRFLTALVEHERVAPLEARHYLAFARLFDEQIVDRLLRQRLGRREAQVDLFGILARIAEQARMHEMVVQHDIGGGEIAESSDADEPGIAGAGADEIDDWSHLRRGRRISAAPCRSSSSATSRPSAGGVVSWSNLLISDDARAVERRNQRAHFEARGA